MSEEHPAVADQQAAPTCFRHPGRETHVRCQRCDRPICPDCMHPAAVGFQCPECIKEGVRSTRQTRTAYGGRRPSTGGLVSKLLIGINAVVFLLILATGGNQSRVLHQLWLLPTATCTQAGFDGRCTATAPGVAGGAYWQLLTSVFTQVQIWHIGFNMVALFLLGPQLESVLGRLRFAALYLLSGLVGSATVYWLAPMHAPTVGASGAIFGLMGALLVVALKVRGDVQGLLTLIAINAAITLFGAGYISWQGHLGGFLGGLLLGVVLVYAPRRHRALWQGLGLAVVVVGVVTAVVLRTAVLT